MSPIREKFVNSQGGEENRGPDGQGTRDVVWMSLGRGSRGRRGNRDVFSASGGKKGCRREDTKEVFPLQTQREPLYFVKEGGNGKKGPAST